MHPQTSLLCSLSCGRCAALSRTFCQESHRLTATISWTNSCKRQRHVFSRESARAPNTDTIPSLLRLLLPCKHNAVCWRTSKASLDGETEAPLPWITIDALANNLSYRTWERPLPCRWTLSCVLEKNEPYFGAATLAQRRRCAHVTAALSSLEAQLSQVVLSQRERGGFANAHIWRNTLRGCFDVLDPAKF